MEMRFTIAAAVLMAAPIGHAAEIFRCAAPNGTVSYQEFACGAESAGGKTALPTAFPEVDVASRDRLFQREAALDRRLEAERERLSREEMNRVSARAQVAAAQAAAQQAARESVYAVVWPLGREYPVGRPPLGVRRPPPRLIR